MIVTWLHDGGLFSRAQSLVRQRGSLSLGSSEADAGDAIRRNRCGAADSRVSSQPGWCVESGHEFAVKRGLRGDLSRTRTA